MKRSSTRHAHWSLSCLGALFSVLAMSQCVTLQTPMHMSSEHTSLGQDIANCTCACCTMHSCHMMHALCHDSLTSCTSLLPCVMTPWHRGRDFSTRPWRHVQVKHMVGIEEIATRILEARNAACPAPLKKLKLWMRIEYIATQITLGARHGVAGIPHETQVLRAKHQL